MSNCSGCARRRKKIKRAFHILIPTKFRKRLFRQRIIKMPWHMHPEWLPSHERDNWIMHRDRALMTMGIKGKHGLRWYQRGNFAMFPPGTTAVGAGGDCSFLSPAISNQNQFSVDPTDAWTHARLHTDGNWYEEDNTTGSWGTSHGGWQGNCAVADYDTRWNQISGDTEQSTLTVGSDGVWTAGSTSAAVGYRLTDPNNLSGSFNLECRDGASLNVLFTDAFLMNCEVDSGC